MNLPLSFYPSFSLGKHRSRIIRKPFKWFSGGYGHWAPKLKLGENEKSSLTVDPVLLRYDTDLIQAGSTTD